MPPLRSRRGRNPIRRMAAEMLRYAPSAPATGGGSAVPHMPEPKAPRTPATPVGKWDILGGGALLAAAGWSVWSSLAVGGSPGPFAALAVACLAAAVLGRILSTIRVWLTPALVATVSVLFAAVSWATVLSPSPGAGLFGYPNAKAAFFVQAGAAALLLAVAAPGPVPRTLGAVAFPAFGIVAPASFSVAASTVLVLPFLGLAGRWNPRTARVLVTVFAGLFLVCLAATALLATRFSPEGEEEPLDRFVQSNLDRRRLALWNDALVLMAEHPLTGIGPGRFEKLRTTAPEDADARWAHHEFLQQGAETGVPGLLLMSLPILVGFLSLREKGDAMAAVGAGALAALGIHACLDYVLHFPAVPLAAAALLGAATVPRAHVSRSSGPMLVPDGRS